MASPVRPPSGGSPCRVPTLVHHPVSRWCVEPAPDNTTRDVAISFASQDRGRADSFAVAILQGGYRVSYVEYGQQSPQGEDLYRHLKRVYGTEARYCLMLVSGHYKDTLWAQPGQAAAQDRAFREDNERILPVRIDDTGLTGPLSTYGYLDLREHSVDQIVELLFAKLRSGTAISTVDRDRTAVSGAAPAPAPSRPITPARPEMRDRDTRRWDAEFRLAAAIFDRVALAQLSADYADALYAAPRLPATVGAVLQTLRQSLCHEEMELVADAALAHEIDSPVVRRQYAQVLVDGANPAAALRFYAELAHDESVPERDRAEAEGGIGRCYKELFLACSDPVRKNDYLQRALDAYLDRYRRDSQMTYHGINAVALLARAERDGIPLDNRGARPAELAEDILATLGADPMPDLWSEATACEAVIALERHDEALEHAEAFVSMNPQGFTVASLLRQLRTVWSLHTAARPGSEVLPVLRSALLHYQGGRVMVAATDVRAARLATLCSGDLERLVDAGRLRTLRWYRQGLLRCRAVAALRVGGAVGTGVLVAGPALHTSLPPVVLLTAASVLPERTQAVDLEVVFPAASADQADPARVEVTQLRRDGWSNAGTEIAVLELATRPTGIEPVPLAPASPRADQERVYVVEQSLDGEGAQFTLQDAALLDRDEHLLHYRAATAPTTPGSPIFDQQWQLVGLHRMHGSDLPPVGNASGTFDGSEGVAIQPLRAQMAPATGGSS